MTTIKHPLARTSPLPSIKPVRTTTPLKSAFATIQPILPDILLEKRRSKKRVRFALKLEAIEEDRILSNHENPVVSTIKQSKRIIEPWRERGPLYGAYVEYLENQDALTPNIREINQPPRPPSPEPDHELSTFTHTFVIQSKSPELVIDSITISTPPTHLPRIGLRSPSPPIKNNNNRKQTIPIVDSYLKQRLNASTPTRKTCGPINNKNHLPSVHSTIKRSDIALPSMKDLNSNEKIIRTNNHFSTKTVNEYFQTKKLTEVVTNPLSGTNNQINYSSNQTKIPSDQPYFFHNQNNDHFQPIIHSTR